VYLAIFDNNLIINLLFILSGYGGATENKSLYAVMKIVYALNSKNHISYRDSRLTHQLHDFLSWESTSVVIACLVSYFQALLFSDFFLEL
jgi:Kinesin motor domain